jgi:inosine/xanthosine triphosphate pyrophosphatase family protein
MVETIQETIKRGVQVEIYTDKHLDIRNGKLKPNSEKGRSILENAGAKLVILKGIHNKAVAVDDSILIEGSFNWLSAVRDKSSPYFRHEVSQIIQGDDAQTQIAQLLEELKGV